MEDGKVLLCLIFNIHPVVPAAVFALVMDIIAVDPPILRYPVAAAQAPETGVVIVRCHHARVVALGAFHLNAGGQGVVCTVCKVGFIDNSAHAPTHSFQKLISQPKPEWVQILYSFAISSNQKVSISEVQLSVFNKCLYSLRLGFFLSAIMRNMRAIVYSVGFLFSDATSSSS